MGGSNIREIARITGVSRSTVCRVLNGGYASADARERVSHAAKTLGYNKNSLAHKLRTDQTHFIGLVVPDISNEFFARMAREIESRFRREGYAVFLCNSGEDPAVQDFYIESLLENRVEAVILVPCSERLSERLLRSGTPVVLADRESLGAEGLLVASVTSDNRAGGALAAAELVERGARRILTLCAGEERSSALRERLDGFRGELAARGLPFRRATVESSSAAAEAWALRALRDRDFDALFCAQDILALGALKALHRAGVDVPGTVQVVGFDGIELGGYVQPALSTVKQEMEGTGRAAAELILKMVRGEPYPARTTLPVAFEHRETTRAAPAARGQEVED